MHQAPALPRWPVLLTLVAGVLGVHLWLLAAGHPFVSMPDTRPDALTEARPATVPDAPDTNGPPATAQPDRVVTVSVSDVRWIAPPPPLAPATPPAPAATRSPPQPPATARARPTPPDAPTLPARERGAAPPAQPLAGPTPEPAPEPAPELAPTDTPTPPADGEPPAKPAPEVVPNATLHGTDTPSTHTQSTTGTDTAVAPLADTRVAAADATAHRPQPPAQPPASARLAYDIRGQAKGLRYSANAQLRWQVEGPRYTAELEISAFLMGSRTQTSQGGIGPGGLMPLRFGDRRRGNEKAAHFDQANQRIRFSNNTPDAPLLPGAQDRLSVFLQLAALLQARPQAYPEGTPLAVQVVSTGGADVWQFQVGPLQTLDLPAGAVSARRLLRAARRDYDSTVEVWLAPSLQHLPVRIRVTEHDGDVADQLLQRPP